MSRMTDYTQAACTIRSGSDKIIRLLGAIFAVVLASAHAPRAHAGKRNSVRQCGGTLRIADRLEGRWTLLAGKDRLHEVRCYARSPEASAGSGSRPWSPDSTRFRLIRLAFAFTSILQ